MLETVILFQTAATVDATRHQSEVGRASLRFFVRYARHEAKNDGYRGSVQLCRGHPAEEHRGDAHGRSEMTIRRVARAVVDRFERGYECVEDCGVVPPDIFGHRGRGRPTADRLVAHGESRLAVDGRSVGRRSGLEGSDRCRDCRVDVRRRSIAGPDARRFVSARRIGSMRCAVLTRAAAAALRCCRHVFQYPYDHPTIACWRLHRVDLWLVPKPRVLRLASSRAPVLPLSSTHVYSSPLPAVAESPRPRLRRRERICGRYRRECEVRSVAASVWLSAARAWPLDPSECRTQACRVGRGALLARH